MASTTDPVAVMSSYTLSCPSSGVTDNFKTVSIRCGYDGAFEPAPAAFTACRVAQDCLPPDPPAATNLEKITSGTLKEFDVQGYRCKAGYSLRGVVHDMVDPATSDVALTCTLSGAAVVVPADSAWPVCLEVQTNCTNFPALPGMVQLQSNVTKVRRGQQLCYASSA